MRQYLIMTMNKSQVEHHEEALSGVLEAKEDCNVYGAPPAMACRQYDRRQTSKGPPFPLPATFKSCASSASKLLTWVPRKVLLAIGEAGGERTSKPRRGERVTM